MASTNAQLARALTRLGDELGAEVLLDVNERIPLTHRERIKARFRALDHTQWEWPDDMAPAELLVVFDFAFGPERNTWTTAAAKMLRRAITQGGLDIARCAFACLWDCSSDDMRVTKADIAEAGTRIRDVVRAADTDRVLVLGGNAGQAWNPTGDLTRLWGKTFLWPGLGQTFVRPVMLPGAVLRDIVSERDWRQQIHGFIQEGNENLGLLNLSRRCIVCSEDVSLYDPFGVPSCRQHAGIVIPGVASKRRGQRQRETLGLLECHESDT